jgi:hypothetical protein
MFQIRIHGRGDQGVAAAPFGTHYSALAPRSRVASQHPANRYTVPEFGPEVALEQVTVENQVKVSPKWGKLPWDFVV